MPSWQHFISTKPIPALQQQLDDQLHFLRPNQLVTYIHWRSQMMADVRHRSKSGHQESVMSTPVSCEHIASGNRLQNDSCHDTEGTLSVTVGTTNITSYSALPISRCHFSPNDSHKTPIARPLGRGMGVFREVEVWPKFYLRSCCARCIIVLYCTVIYQKSIVLHILWRLQRYQVVLELTKHHLKHRPHGRDNS